MKRLDDGEDGDRGVVEILVKIFWDESDELLIIKVKVGGGFFNIFSSFSPIPTWGNDPIDFLDE